jgi:hypothetical protein
VSSPTCFPLNGAKPSRASTSTPACVKICAAASANSVATRVTVTDALSETVECTEDSIYTDLMRVHIFWRRSALVALLIATTAAAAMAQGGRVAGTVKNESGEGIKGATVIAENPEATPGSFTATTDDKGRFAMLGLKGGRWILTAQAPGFSAQTGQMLVRQLPAENRRAAERSGARRGEGPAIGPGQSRSVVQRAALGRGD